VLASYVDLKPVVCWEWRSGRHFLIASLAKPRLKGK